MAYVALDIGHGENTWEVTGGKGVVVDGKAYEEHHFNADVTMRTKAILEAHGVKVWLPQQPYKPDRNLQSRTDEANRRGVDLYWSTHANAGIRDARGSCAFYWHTAEESKQLAEQFAKNVEKAGFRTHGDGTHASKRGSWTNLHVCRETAMTAVLTENGFMTNPQDFELIFGDKHNWYRGEVAKIHAKTILHFFGIKYDHGKTEVVKGVKTVLYSREHVNHGKAVKEIQEKLLKLGYDLGGYGADGKFGPATEKAVKAFQRDQGIQVDGVVGPVTMRELKEAYKQATAPKKPKGDMYRVIFNEEQVGAFLKDNNVLDMVNEGMKQDIKSITIERV